MARTLLSLKLEAVKSAKRRCHDMGEWIASSARPETLAASECKRCGAFVTANSKPMPNEINIGGSAVAVNCGPRGDK